MGVTRTKNTLKWTGKNYDFGRPFNSNGHICNSLWPGGQSIKKKINKQSCDMQNWFGGEESYFNEQNYFW